MSQRSIRSQAIIKAMSWLTVSASLHRKALAGEFLQNEEDRFEKANGTVQWLRWQIRPWYGLDRTIGGIGISTEDITARKQIEEQLSRSEERFRSLVEATADAVWTGRLVDGEVYVPVWKKFTGQTQEEAYRDWTIAVDPDDREEVVAAWSRFTRHGGVSPIVCSNVTANIAGSR